MFYKIITIGRQYGSGGCEIGELIAKKLGIDFYDINLLELAVQNSKLEPEEITDPEDKKRSQHFFSLFEQSNRKAGFVNSKNDQLFLMQSQIIRDIATEKRCVIVGRCADFVLRGRSDVLPIFIHGEIESRISRIMTKKNLDKKEAAALISHTDKNRSFYYNYFTEKKWGDKDVYAITLNSSKLGIHTCAEYLSQFMFND